MPDAYAPSITTDLPTDIPTGYVISISSTHPTRSTGADDLSTGAEDQERIEGEELVTRLPYDALSDRQYLLPRETQVRAVMTLLAHGEGDLAPMLFAPCADGRGANADKRGYGHCRVCGRHRWLNKGTCRQIACAGEA